MNLKKKLKRKTLFNRKNKGTQSVVLNSTPSDPMPGDPIVISYLFHHIETVVKPKMAERALTTRIFINLLDSDYFDR